MVVFGYIFERWNELFANSHTVFATGVKLASVNFEIMAEVDLGLFLRFHRGLKVLILKVLVNTGGSGS